MLDILIVEDNELNAILLKEICLSLGLSVSISFSYKQAKKMIQSRAGNLFHIILMDLCLPDGNGIALAKEIKKIKGYKDIPFVLLSGASLSLNDIDLKKFFVANVSKPIEVSALKNLLLKLKKTLLKDKKNSHSKLNGCLKF